VGHGVPPHNQKVPNLKTKLVDGKPVVETTGQRHFGSSDANFPCTHVTLSSPSRRCSSTS